MSIRVSQPYSFCWDQVHHQQRPQLSTLLLFFCDCLSFSPFYFRLAALLFFFAPSEDLYTLLLILFLSLCLRKCVQKGVGFSWRWEASDARDEIPSLKEHTANAYASSTPTRPVPWGKISTPDGVKLHWHFVCIHLYTFLEVTCYQDGHKLAWWVVRVPQGSDLCDGILYLEPSFATCHLHQDVSPSGYKWCLGTSSVEL